MSTDTITLSVRFYRGRIPGPYCVAALVEFDSSGAVSDGIVISSRIEGAGERRDIISVFLGLLEHHAQPMLGMVLYGLSADLERELLATDVPELLAFLTVGAHAGWLDEHCIEERDRLVILPLAMIRNTNVANLSETECFSICRTIY